MRIAVCLRGISYLENYQHKYGLPPYTIDFRDTSESILTNLIQPLRDDGYDVDVFFETYHHVHEEELRRTYNPVKEHFKDYQAIPIGISQTLIGEPMLIDQHLECIKLIETYEKDNNLLYDQILITRFDLYFYKKITTVGLDFYTFNYSFMHLARSPNGTIFSSEDNFIFYPRAKNNKLIACFNQMKIDGHSTHLSGKYLVDSVETVKYLFGEKGDGAYDYPFYKFGRHIFGNVKEYELNDILNIPMNRLDGQEPYGIHVDKTHGIHVRP